MTVYPGNETRACVRWLLGSAVLIALGLPIAPAAPVTPADAKSGKVIVRPQPGAKKTHPLPVVVRARDGLFDLRARLNGRKIGRDFGRTRRGKRRALISRSHGLRRGRNVLRVAARRRNGKWRRKKVRFSVGHKRPISGAGRDRRVVAGEPFRLRGKVLRSRHEGRPVRFRWRVAKVPKHSKYAGQARNASESGAPGLVGNGRRPRASFNPDVEGHYKLKLRATQGSRSGVDTVRLSAVPSTPFVPIDTMANISGRPGVKVGEEFYTAPSGGFYRSWYQMLVLDRRTLGFVSNTTYVCPFPSPCEQDKIISDLSKLDDTKLVIAVNHPGDARDYFHPGGSPPFQRIGVPVYDEDQSGRAPSGSFSAIGVPGLPQGQADHKFVIDGPQGAGRMEGYLTTDQYFNYTWLPDERPTFDTRAAGTVGGDRGNVIQVGDKTYPSEGVGSTPGSFQVLVLDGHTLTPVRNATFRTNCPTCPQGSTRDVTAMKNMLNGVRGGDVVAVTSIGSQGQRLIGPDADNGAATDLGGAIASVGGTRHVLHLSGGSAGAAYSLIGDGGAGEGHAEETSSLKDPQPGDGRLRGALTPDHRSLFKPTAVSLVGGPSEALHQLLLKPGVAWPLDGNAGAQKAIAYLGSQDKRLGANPRSAYWIQGFDQATWNDIATSIRDVTYPGEAAGFSEADFLAAKTELVQEIIWVGRVRAYLGLLSAPFSKVALSSWADLQGISDDLTAALKPPGDSVSQTFVFEIFVTLTKISPVAPPKVIGGIFQTVVKYLQQNRDGSDPSQIRTKATKLAAELTANLEETQATFRNVGDIIVSDYEKLKTVGTLGACNPTSADCPQEWSFTPSDQQQAASQTYKGIEAAFYDAFMKLSFPSYRLSVSAKHHNAREWYCARGGGTFRGDLNPFDNPDQKVHLPDTGQAELYVGPARYQVHAFGTSFQGNEIYKMRVPPDDNLTGCSELSRQT